MRRFCLTPGCPNDAEVRGRCATCASGRPGRNKAFYDSKRWKMVRRHQLFVEPLCACGAIAVDVDHIVRIEDGGAKYASSNLQSLCRTHHGQKTRAEQLGRAAPRIGGELP